MDGYHHGLGVNSCFVCSAVVDTAAEETSFKGLKEVESGIAVAFLYYACSWMESLRIVCSKKKKL